MSGNRNFFAGRNTKWYSHLKKKVWQFPEKVNILLPYDPAIAFLGIYLTELKTYVHIKTCTRIFITALFIIVQTWKQPRCLSKRKWINKLWYIYKMDYKFAIKRNELSSQKKSWRILKCIILSERSQYEKTTCYMIPAVSHSGTGKIVKKVRKVSGCQVLGSTEITHGAQGMFRALKLSCMIL